MEKSDEHLQTSPHSRTNVGIKRPLPLYDLFSDRFTSKMLLVLLLATVAAASESEETFASAVRDPNTQLVFVGTRHGNRNPGQFLKDVPWGKEGENELTTVSELQY